MLSSGQPTRLTSEDLELDQATGADAQAQPGRTGEAAHECLLDERGIGRRARLAHEWHLAEARDHIGAWLTQLEAGDAALAEACGGLLGRHRARVVRERVGHRGLRGGALEHIARQEPRCVGLARGAAVARRRGRLRGRRKLARGAGVVARRHLRAPAGADDQHQGERQSTEASIHFVSQASAAYTDPRETVDDVVQCVNVRRPC